MNDANRQGACSGVPQAESQSKPGTKMVDPEPCFKNQEGGHPQLLMAGTVPYQPSLTRAWSTLSCTKTGPPPPSKRPNAARSARLVAKAAARILKLPWAASTASSSACRTLGSANQGSSPEGPERPESSPICFGEKGRLWKDRSGFSTTPHANHPTRTCPFPVAVI